MTKYEADIPGKDGWGDWFSPYRNWKHACCDCSLIHDVQFRISGRDIEMRLRRNNRATAAMRREEAKKRRRDELQGKL